MTRSLQRVLRAELLKKLWPVAVYHKDHTREPLTKLLKLNVTLASIRLEQHYWCATPAQQFPARYMQRITRWIWPARSTFCALVRLILMSRCPWDWRTDNPMSRIAHCVDPVQLFPFWLVCLFRLVLGVALFRSLSFVSLTVDSACTPRFVAAM